MRRIYFAGSISAGRDHAHIYSHLVELLAEHGEVLTEHIGHTGMGEDGELGQLSEKEIHDRDIAWLRQSDVLVGEVTLPSLGVGYEIGKAEEWGKGILCLYRDAPGHKMLSSMLIGAEGVVCRAYTDVSELPAILEEFFAGLDAASDEVSAATAEV
jgi:hypothetical protein